MELIILLVKIYLVLGVLHTIYAIVFERIHTGMWDFNIGGGLVPNWIAYLLAIGLWLLFILERVFKKR